MTAARQIRPCAAYTHAADCDCQTAATVHGAVLAYVGDGTGDLPLATIREDLERIIHQHPTVDSASTTPRGFDGACDIEAFDFDGAQIALVTLDAKGHVEALTPEDPPALTERTPAEWDAYIRSAANWADASDRMQEAADAGVDFAAMTAARDR